MLAREPGAWGRTRLPLGDRARDALEAAVQGGFPAPACDVEMAGRPAAERDPPQAPTPATSGERQERAHASCASAGPAADRAAREDGATAVDDTAAVEGGPAGYTADTGGAPPWPAQDAGAAGRAYWCVVGFRRELRARALSAPARRPRPGRLGPPPRRR